MQAVIPGEGRRARMERFRKEFSKRREPFSGPRSSKVPMSEAAEKLQIHRKALESVLARCKAKNKMRGGVELCYDFKAVPIWLQGGQIQNGVLSEEGFRAIYEYMKLRLMVKERILTPVSRALVSNPAIIARSGRQIEILDEFVLSNVKFPDLMPPLLRLSPVGHGFQVPVREFKNVFYSFVDYLEPIVFAARIRHPSPLTQFAEIDRIRKEAAKATSSAEIPVSLGMRLWMLREIYANPMYEGALSMRNSELMTKILMDSVVLDFFAKSYNTYIDPKIHGTESGFKEARQIRKIFLQLSEKAG